MWPGGHIPLHALSGPSPGEGHEAGCGRPAGDLQRGEGDIIQRLPSLSTSDKAVRSPDIDQPPCSKVNSPWRCCTTRGWPIGCPERKSIRVAQMQLCPSLGEVK